MVDIQSNEIEELVEWLSNISEDGEGVTRLLYSQEWIEAQSQLKEKFEELGMDVEFDAVGNLFGTIKGTDEPEKIIATGSHIDTVVNGGRLDGQLGILGGYLAIKHLIEKNGAPKKSLQIISMAEEEGSRFPYAFWGSKNIFGIANKEDVANIADKDGVKFVDAMHNAGFDFLETAPKHNDLEAFIELHIEQGNFLEEEGASVGIVNSIVGQKRYDVVLKGQANHAGTTLMSYRKDTVEAFSRIAVNGIDKAKAIGNPLVLTFGRVNPLPNTVNVVPGEVSFSIDCRHTDQNALNEFTAELEEDMKRIATEMGISIDINLWMDEAPVPMDENIIQTIEQVCVENKLNYKVMHSGAGHDAQIYAPRVSTGMIFVPSIKGISHNPAEHTETSDIIQGIEALKNSLEKLAY
ncbi:allantoate deiminase [Fundicoccus culcitae]|uniref:Allantoate deiminase n=1 Tax=Fundicoccus culcitae TaxID=2969821 RepID=A0ABY5P992_9LACT|nr:allantoate deiminase [Fundicoccus culcitae]UUX35318.1 allantoate deiminase [Fundicoccus culcitae]